MNKDKIVEQIVNQWVKLADKDLLAAKLILEASPVVSDIVCFHSQQATEKFLKAFLVKNQKDT